MQKLVALFREIFPETLSDEQLEKVDRYEYFMNRIRIYQRRAAWLSGLGIAFSLLALLLSLLDKQKNVTPLGLHREVKSHSQILASGSVHSSVQVLPQRQSLPGQQSVFSLVGRSVYFGKQEWNTIYAGNVANVNHMARQINQFGKTIFGDTNKQMWLEFPAQHFSGVLCHLISSVPSANGNQQGDCGKSISKGHGSSVLNSRGSSPQEGM